MTTERDTLAHEQAVIGCALLGTAGHSGILSLDENDYQDARHRIIAATARDMIMRGKHLDARTLADELAARGKLATPGGAGGSSYLHQLADTSPASVTATYWAEEVRRNTRLRRATSIGQQLIETLAAEQARAELDEVLARHRDLLATLPTELGATEEELPTITRLLAADDDPDDWLIPGLLERGERVVITGGEGGGKSTMLKQFALCFAAGLNPWNGQRVSDGLRVLYIDAELSTAQNRRNYRWIRNVIARRLTADGYGDRLFHYVRNDGLDLPGRDREWFHHVAARTNPDVIIAGPAYKCMFGNEKDDVDVLRLLRTLDEVRVKHNAALILETHSPHGGLEEDSRPARPIGSSVWLRWPEIGFGFKRDKSDQVPEQLPTPDHLRVVAWRGSRDERDWPDLIRWGVKHSEFPWVPTRPGWAPSVDLGYTIDPPLRSVS